MKKLSLFLLLFASILISCNNNEETSETSNTSDNETLTPEATISAFLSELGNMQCAAAFLRSENPNWGDYSDFTSANSFGGISGVTINELTLYPNEGDMAVVYADVFYEDKINGSNTYKQKFYLKQYGDEWKIVDMKLVTGNTSKNTTTTTNSNPQNCVYTNGNIYLIIYQYSSGYTSFEGVLINKSNGLCITGMDVFYENGKWSAEDMYDPRDINSLDCYVEMSFNNNTVTLKSANNCYNLNSTLTKKTNYSTPSTGNYSFENSNSNGELNISEIDGNSIGFELYIATSSGCTGEVAEYDEYSDEYFSEYAYGVNGLYVYTNSNSTCALMISFGYNSVTVTELYCDLRGGSCSFNGTYNKE